MLNYCLYLDCGIKQELFYGLKLILEETKTRKVPGKVLVTLQKGHVGLKTEEYSHLLNTGSNKIGS